MHIAGIQLTQDQLKAALRLYEADNEDETHSVPKPMLLQLATVGLVTHVGKGCYESTAALTRLRSEYMAGKWKEFRVVCS